MNQRLMRFCRKLPTLFYCAAFVLSGCSESSEGFSFSWLSPELSRLKEAGTSLHGALNLLPAAPPPQVTQRLGWHSLYSSSTDTVEWIDLTFDKPERIDSITLIAPPPIGGNEEPGYGFPLRFRIEFLINNGEEEERTVVADHTQQDFPNPGLLPVLIDTHGQEAEKIRITATRLVQAGSRYVVALGEVILLQGNRNLGARLEYLGTDAVKASSSQGTRPDWGRINLVDGQTVLGPPLGTNPSSTLGYRSAPHSESEVPPPPWVSIDLGASVPIDQIRLFPAHPPEFGHTTGYGFPVRYQIELREAADSPPVILPAPQAGSYNGPPGDNVVEIEGGSQTARFVRLLALEPQVSNGRIVLALAEMEIWSDGKNVALGKPVTALDSAIEAEGWSTAALVDGFTSRANIVKWYHWLDGLSKRRELLHHIALLESRATVIRSQLKKVSEVVILLLLGGFTFASGAVYLQQKRLRRSEVEALRLRFSQDLHDEIGSSLGSIAFITDDAAAHTKEESTRSELHEIRVITLEAIESMRDLVQLSQSGKYGDGDLTDHLRGIANRVLRSIPFSFDDPAGPSFNKAPVPQRRDIVLMFKEALHNLLKHARATNVQISLTQPERFLCLTVQDNGSGFDLKTLHSNGMGLSNLKRRAAKHGGSVDIHSAPGLGTTLKIRFPIHE